MRVAETAAEREAVFSFRYRVYVEELKLSPPEADHKRRILCDALDDVAIAYALWQGQRVVGSLRVLYFADLNDLTALTDKFRLQPTLEAFGVDAICSTSRFMLDPKLRHGRAILRLMQATYLDGVARGVRFNYGDCSPHLVPFYEHLGYRRYTHAYNDTHYGYKLPIVMLWRDHKWFRRVRSPLARFVERQPDDSEARAWFESSYPEFLDVESASLLADGIFFDLLQERVGNDPLHSLSILAGLERSEADLFLSEATLIQARTGDRILREGERDETLFVMLSGIAEVTQSGAPNKPVRVMGAGDTFGEIGFLINVNRTANVTARVPSEVLVLSSEFLKRFLRKEPVIAAKLLFNLSRMLAGRLVSVAG